MIACDSPSPSRPADPLAAPAEPPSLTTAPLAARADPPSRSTAPLAARADPPSLSTDTPAAAADPPSRAADPTAACPGGKPGRDPASGNGPLRNGNPRGNPNLAPRCGARARSGNPCRAPAMPNGRCRTHGGKCTGPRTPEGRARSIAAHTTHGKSTAAKRAVQRYVRALITRARLFDAAVRLRAFLPPAMAVRVALGPAELKAPDHPSEVAFSSGRDPNAWNVREGAARTGRAAASGAAGGAARHALRVREVERRAALAEAASQAPWRQAIAFARAAKRAARAARGAARAGVAEGAAQIPRSDAMKPEDPRGGGLGSGGGAPVAQVALGQVLAARQAERARAAEGAAQIPRSDAMKPENRHGGGGLGSGGGGPGPRVALRDVLAARQAQRARAAGAGVQIPRSDAMKPEDRCGGGGLRNGGGGPGPRVALREVLAARQAERARAAKGAALILRSDAMKPEDRCGGGGLRNGGGGHAAPAALGQVLAARQAERAGAPGGATQILRSDAMKPEDRRGGGDLEGGGGEHAAPAALGQVLAAREEERARAAEGAALIPRSDAMKPGDWRGGGGSLNGGGGPGAPAALGQVLAARQAERAGAPGGAALIPRSDAMKPEDWRGGGGAGRGGTGQAAQGALQALAHQPGQRSVPAFQGKGVPPLPRQAVVCSSGSRAAGVGPAGVGPAGVGPAGVGPAGVGPAGVGPARCVLHLPRFNAVKREKGGAPRLARLNPSKAVVQRGATLARMRARSVFATLEALLARAAPLTAAGAALPLAASLGRDERTGACTSGGCNRPRPGGVLDPGGGANLRRG